MLSLLPNSSLPQKNTSRLQPIPVFLDRFAEPAISKDRWIKTYPWGSRINPGNPEQQYYRDDAAYISDHHLVLEANRANPFERMLMQQNDGIDVPFTSGMVNTYGYFAQQYGYFELQAKIPKGDGLVSAFWMLPQHHDPKTGDYRWPPGIGIMKVFGHNTTSVQTDVTAGETNAPRHHFQDIDLPIDLSNDYHAYGLDWQPKKMTWYLDGQKIREYSGPDIPHEPCYLLANLAIGKANPWGSPDSETQFPARFEIKQISAYPLNTVNG